MIKSHTECLTFDVPSRMDFINITPQVEESVTKSGVKEGILLGNTTHIIASVFNNDDETGLHLDYRDWLGRPASSDPSLQRSRHTRTGGLLVVHDSRQSSPL